jgi:GT2 family glycosyltransferase
MTLEATSSRPVPAAELPLVSAVFVSYNRRDALRESLCHMRDESGYPQLELIVVDNASSDGTPDMLRADYPDVRLIESGGNLGAPAWNQGFRVARGKYVLILDDDAYMRPGALTEAVRAAEAEGAGLISFSIVSSFDESYRFNVDEYKTGLLSFWGCAALVSRAALDELGGYDPNIFIWANELELTMRLLDRGYVHLHLPDVEAVHMKEPDDPTIFKLRNLRNNFRHWGYVAGKLMRPSDALLTVASLLLQAAVEAVARDRRTIKGFVPAISGFVAGLRNRQPVRPVVSSTYRKNFRDFDWSWRYWRSPVERVRALAGGDSADEQRRRPQSAYFEDRPNLYPQGRASLRL